MTVVVSGGGSGGHISPVIAVAAELKKLSPQARIEYIGQRQDQFADVINSASGLDGRRRIFAGKFRRYHGRGWLAHLFDIKTNLLNIRDAFYVGLGILQSIILVKRLKPDVVFLKGGYVCVPVGMAAAFWRIPIVTHDSDVLPGLANRLVSRWATAHAVGMPKEAYAYDQSRTFYTGVPVAAEFTSTPPELQAEFRREIGLPDGAQVITVTGGSQGAQRLNRAIRAVAGNLLARYPQLHLVLIVGPINEQAERDAYASLPPDAAKRVHVLGYTTHLYRYTGAADLVLTRSGATTMAELALQGRACIVVPNPFLTGGHQLKNADALAAKEVVEVISEADLATQPQVLEQRISALLQDKPRRDRLGQKLAALAKPGAAGELAALILKYAKHHKQQGAGHETGPV